jgi:hypothetical protein
MDYFIAKRVNLTGFLIAMKKIAVIKESNLRRSA